MMVSAERLAEVKAVAIAESFTTAQTARILNVSESTVRRLRANRRLYAFPHGRQWLYPAWQFGGGAPIPGLEELVRAIPLSMHPAFVRGLMLAPRDRLAEGDVLESPREFLIKGGEPKRVIAILEALEAL